MNFNAIRDWAVGVSLVVSGGLWLAVVWFYTELGLRPSDVGVGLGEVLEQSVGVLVFVAVMLSTLVLLLAEVALPIIAVVWRNRPPVTLRVRVDSRKAAQAGPGQRLVSGWVPIGVALPALVWVSDDATTRFWVGLVIGGAVVCSFVWVLVVDAAVVARAIAVMTCLLVAGSIAAAWIDAADAANQVKDGLAFHDEFAGITSTPIAARPTRVKLGGVERCLLFLGAAGGATILFDPRSDKVERVPSSDLRLTLDRTMAGCG